MKAIRNVNQLITHVRDRDTLLKGVCDCLTETGGYYNAWVALLDERKTLIAGYESGLGEDFCPMVQRLEAHLRGETPSYESRFRMKHKSGDWMWIQDRGKVIEWDDDGNPTRACGTHLDITKERRLKERIRQMQKMDAVGQLAGGVAHDFNNQLSAFMGYADMLRTRLDEPELREYADYVLVGARRAADLTRKLLAFSRQGHYQSIPVDIHDIVHEVVHLLNHSIDKKIEIQQVLKATPSITLGDPG